MSTGAFQPSDSCNSRNRPVFNCSARRTNTERFSRVPPKAVNWRESLTVRFSGLSRSGATVCARATAQESNAAQTAIDARFTADGRTSAE